MARPSQGSSLRWIWFSRQSSELPRRGHRRSEPFHGWCLVGARGFEPRTSCAQGRRATRLRYAPTRTAALILKHFPVPLLLQFLA